MLRENEVTLGQMFQDAGYQTGMFGKWHLGDNYPFRPEDRGFGEVMRHGGGGVGQTPDYWDNAYFDGSYWHNEIPTPVDGFCTDVFFDYAKIFIKQQKDADQPFFAYISTNAPHGPMHTPPQFSDPYQKLGTHLANFYGMIANIDQNVGQLRQFLRDEGLTENTIFIFTSDNGTSSGAKVFNAGMRGSKGSEYDGGHRAPFFLHWPAGGFDSAKDVKEITAHVDIAPTLLDLCDIRGPAETKFDGRSLVPLMRGDNDNWPDRILITDSQRVKDPIRWKQSAVMTSRWRLINGKELFDINVDPGQQRNVATGYPEVVQRLTKFYEAWWNELEPTFAQQTSIYLGHPAENPARLTSHDWITTGSTPWNQASVRSAMNGENNTGYWNVNIFQPGNYKVQLRRWPEEADTEIRASLPPGDDVPGEKAFRARPGKAINASTASLRIGDQKYETNIPPGAKQVVFEVTLATPGPTTLEALFHSDSGELHGAYYVYVEKLKDT